MSVILLPVSVHLAHQVTTGLVDGQGRIEREIQFDQLVTDCVPFLRARFGRLFPQPSRLAKSMLLVVVVVIKWIVLDHLGGEHGFGQAVPVLHRQ